MIEYPKIETLYKRSITGDKSLIVGDYRNPVIEMLAKFNIWNAYEKLDGSNHQIFWDGHNINLYGRTDRSNITNPILDYFNDKFNNIETEELFEQLFGDKQYIFYFEAIGNKIQYCGKYYGDDPRFVLLDVYNVNNNSWWSYGNSSDIIPNQFTINSIAKALNVECKQLIMKGTLDDFVDYIQTVPLSTFTKEDGPNYPMEGIVAVPNIELKDSNGDRVIVKIKCCDHIKNFKQILKNY